MGKSQKKMPFAPIHSGVRSG
eukprot:COSAG06_NODE_70916_length_189_cov_29.966667_1_plen_20_part_01